MRIFALSAYLAVVLPQVSVAQKTGIDSASPSKTDRANASTQMLKSAIRKSIGLLETASAGSAKQRKCFTCHNQALPVLALVKARQRGFAIDEKNLNR